MSHQLDPKDPQLAMRSPFWIARLPDSLSGGWMRSEVRQNCSHVK